MEPAHQHRPRHRPVVLELVRRGAAVHVCPQDRPGSLFALGPRDAHARVGRVPDLEPLREEFPGLDDGEGHEAVAADGAVGPAGRKIAQLGAPVRERIEPFDDAFSPKYVPARRFDGSVGGFGKAVVLVADGAERIVGTHDVEIDRLQLREEFHRLERVDVGHGICLVVGDDEYMRLWRGSGVSFHVRFLGGGGGFQMSLFNTHVQDN